MNIRPVHTKIWRDEWFIKLSRSSSRLFLYLLTNDFIGFSGFVEISDRQISFDTGLTAAELEKAKKELSPKVRFFNGWLFIVNYSKYDPIKGDNNNLWKALEKELLGVPPEIRHELEAPYKGVESPSGGTIITIRERVMVKEEEGGVGETRKYSSINDITPDDIQEISDKYKVTVGFVNLQFEKMKNWLASSGKVKKDYKATLRNFVIGDMQKEIERRSSDNKTVDARHIR
jgi:hypothetical protein